MIEAYTRQRLAVGQALRHERFICTLCSTKIKRPDISYVPLRQSRDVHLPS